MSKPFSHFSSTHWAFANPPTPLSAYTFADPPPPLNGYYYLYSIVSYLLLLFLYMCLCVLLAIYNDAQKPLAL